VKVQAKPIDSVRPYPGRTSFRRASTTTPWTPSPRASAASGSGSRDLRLQAMTAPCRLRSRHPPEGGRQGRPREGPDPDAGQQPAADLSAEQVRAYRLADNASAEKAEWDHDSVGTCSLWSSRRSPRAASTPRASASIPTLSPASFTRRRPTRRAPNILARDGEARDQEQYGGIPSAVTCPARTRPTKSGRSGSTTSSPPQATSSGWCAREARGPQPLLGL